MQRAALELGKMKAAETYPTPLKSAPLWPLSVAAYRALGEAGLIRKNTELLYGALPAGCILRTEQPVNLWRFRAGA